MFSNESRGPRAQPIRERIAVKLRLGVSSQVSFSPADSPATLLIVLHADLKFFEPYLWVVLVEWGLSLGQIGMLVSVEKITCYLFELPSGYLADRWGMRKELCLCFIFYIIAFVLYYYGRSNFGFLLGAAFLCASLRGTDLVLRGNSTDFDCAGWPCVFAVGMGLARPCAQAPIRQWFCSGLSETT